MRLTCPQCHTEYEVPDAALAGRARTLRCGDCGTQFKAPALPEPGLPEAELPEAALPEAAFAAPEPAVEIHSPDEIAAEPEPGFEPDAEAAEPAFAEPVPEPEPEPAFEPEPETVIPEPVAPLSATRTVPAPPKPVLPPAAPKPSRGLGISVLLLLILIGIVLAEHRAIGHAWPPSLRLFNALGLH